MSKNTDKQPIKIWEKPLSNGNKSLVLKRWDGTKYQYEFLHRYIVPEKTPFDKQNNKDARLYAQTVRAQRMIELANGEAGLRCKGNRHTVKLIEYIQSIADKKKDLRGTKRGTYLTYAALMHHIKQYSGENTTFKQIDKQYCQGFVEYLKYAKNIRTGENIKNNSQVAYYRTLKAVLNCAVTDDIINTNPTKYIKNEDQPRKRKNEIIYLLPSEISKLIKTPYDCRFDIRNAFLFACFTGLRFSDIELLTWDKIRNDDNGNFSLIYIQKKTGKQEYLPIAKKALDFIPERPENALPSDRVFKLSSNGYTNLHLSAWCKLSGINNKITFHTARHTTATLLLANGVPIETISKILGHTNISTTAGFYAEVIDRNKRAAVNTLDNIL